jgi:hypothetical protein
MALPIIPPTKAPAIPSSIVTKIPPGSRPGITSLARAPTIKPMNNIHRKCTITSTKSEAQQGPFEKPLFDSAINSNDWTFLRGVHRLQLNVFEARVIDLLGGGVELFCRGGLNVHEQRRSGSPLCHPWKGMLPPKKWFDQW